MGNIPASTSPEERKTTRNGKFFSVPARDIIITEHLDEKSRYTRYEVISFANETGLNTSYIVTKDDSAAETILGFFEQSFWKTLNTSRADIRNACERLERPLGMMLKPFHE